MSMCRCYYCDEPFDSDVEGSVTLKYDENDNDVYIEVCGKCQDKLPEES